MIQTSAILLNWSKAWRDWMPERKLAFISTVFFRESSSERYGGQNMVMGKLQDESRLENDHISVWICDTEDECSLNQ